MKLIVVCEFSDVVRLSCETLGNGANKSLLVEHGGRASLCIIIQVLLYLYDKTGYVPEYHQGGLIASDKRKKNDRMGKYLTRVLVTTALHKPRTRTDSSIPTHCIAGPVKEIAVAVPGYRFKLSVQVPDPRA